MSTKNRLLNLGITLPSPKADTSSKVEEGKATSQHTAEKLETRFPPLQPGTSVARTGPGQMLQFRGQMLAVEGELTKLRNELKEHEGASPTRLLDPKAVLPSRWANRHEASFDSAQFFKLKDDISAAGGNVQAIRVRPADGHPGKFEIVYGHRRHRACLELGIPVLATIDQQPMSDQDLFVMMDRENRARADLSAHEQGMMYRRALDAGLYASNRKMADALGVSHTWISKALAVADLPEALVACFSSPVDITHRYAEVLAAELARDKKGLLKRAERVRQISPKPTPAHVLKSLMPSGSRSEESKAALVLDGKRVGQWTRSGRFGLTIQLTSVPESLEQRKELMAEIVKLLDS